MAAPDTALSTMAAGKRTRLVIGIDFGTTFSGFCWAIQGGEEEMEVIREWPGKGNSTSQKVPTVLSYHDGNIKWGYQVDDTKAAVRGIKLLLDRSKELRYGPAIQSERLIQEMCKKPVEVAGEYLEKVVSHAKDILQRRGIGSLMRTMDVQYILTVPAVWSDKAKDLTLRAAYHAGIQQSSVTLLSEPEAAAVYTIRTIQPNSIAKDDCFIVCDAGGGTVDLITYRITQTEPIRMEEVTEGTGDMCGSVVLDELFEAFLCESMGKETYQAMPDVNKRHTLQRWQADIKTSYSGPEDDDDCLDGGYMVPVPGVPDLPEKQISQGMLHMENEDVQKIFDPVITKIEILISNQQDEATKAGVAAKAILLVGGLGSSEYLYKRLKHRFGGLEIMQPQNAWSAVVRGAVYRGFEGNQVQNRKSRCHYGVAFSCPFFADVHRGKAKRWCEYQEQWMVDGNMQWYIKKGDSVSEEKPITFSFCRHVPLDDPLVFHEDLQFCMMESAPSWINKNVCKHCELEADLSKIPKELFARQNSKGLRFYYVPFDLVLTPTSASLLFELRVSGMSYGSVRARYY